jgi:hypothetical protein
MDYDLDTQLEELAHWEWLRRMEAVRRLELIGDQAAVPQLAETLRGDESQYVRAAAARGLGRLGGGDAVDALVAALEDKDFHVRQAALWSLGEIGAAAEPALPAIQPLTQSRERFTQAEMTVSELAEIVVGEIEFAVKEKAEAEAKAKAEAEAKAQTEAQAKAEAQTAAPAEAVAKAEPAEAVAPAAEAPAAPRGESADEARLRRRQEALARKRELDKLRSEAG